MSEPRAAEIRAAQISECGRYRYTLARVWNETLPHVLWVMLNPSTADADQDDPTIRKCMAFSHRWGFGGLVVVNLFALRATDPKTLKTVDDPAGPENEDVILREADRASKVVTAWGNGGALLNRGRTTLQDLRSRGGVYHIGPLTKLGQPQHPLYLSYTTELVSWVLTP